MPSRTPRFPDLTTTDIRVVKRLTGHLVEAPDLDTLGRELLRGTEKILPADFMVWNQWTLPMDALLGFEANHDHYNDELVQLDAALVSTIHHHPVIAAGQLDSCGLRPQRMSDYQCDRAFKANPLYQEVYRYLDSRHQIAYTAAKLDDSQIILSWNLGHRDFTDREVQLLHLLGMQVAVLSRAIEERRHLRLAWKSLRASLDSGVPAAGAALATSDGRVLGGLIRGEARAEIAASLNWRRDTLDRHLGGLRERLGYENTAQLMQALAILKPGPG